MHHKGKVSYLDSPERRKELPPEEILDMLSLKDSEFVLDFGAGTGYFSIPAAKRTDGTVYALDTDDSMLDIIRSKALQEELTNIVPIQKLSLPDHTIDAVIASLVLHEIDPLVPALHHIQQVLKKDGYLICVELEPNGVSHHEAPRVTSEQMEKAITAAGLRVIRKFYPTEKIYVLLAQK
ncbi:methyltransferase family protein [Sinobaca qinghaiensis]|uniref:Methyltransferase family protein n=1 Tax=Sinobaca qinghaiensis TaxID=342944 RepID=A0A419V7F8_9BACL|nr:class I SAM-dependent methyltransferase [Sinobaca qinghaiensis]RKD75992.1 methyltransferase family protein [Sinobaca qinghaiensis]